MIHALLKLKFYKDLYTHYYRYRFNNPYAQYPYNPLIPIPKVFHYAWFGPNDFPPIIKQCMQSWEDQDGYTIKKWDESNFPFEMYPFAQQAYEQKKWAMVADVARLHAVFFEGGIYIDTDVELLRPLDSLLKYGAFACVESNRMISIGTLGAKQYHPWVGLILLWYYKLKFKEEYKIIANTRIVTRINRLFYNIKIDGAPFVLPNDVHVLSGSTLLPKRDGNGEFIIGEDTYAIHHGTGLW